jgi:hypothetical protein
MALVKNVERTVTYSSRMASVSLVTRATTFPAGKLSKYWIESLCI